MWIAKHMFKNKLSYIGFGGHGNQVRDVIHIDDVCKIILIQIKQIKSKHNKIFNIGGGIKNAISLNDLTSKCIKLTGNKLYPIDLELLFSFLELCYIEET